MKQKIQILSLFIFSLSFSQSIDIETNFGGRGCRLVNSAACSMEPSTRFNESTILKEESSMQLQKINLYTLELIIPKAILSKEEKDFLLVGVEENNTGEGEFEIAEDIILDNIAFKELQLSSEYNVIAKGYYPMQITDKEFIVTILLQKQ